MDDEQLAEVRRYARYIAIHGEESQNSENNATATPRNPRPADAEA
jgi:hypothetical protein